MIVRTYGRRTRCLDSPSAAPDAGVEPEDSDFHDLPFSQESSQDRFNFSAAFSSQDSSPWSLDPDLFPSIREPDDPLLLPAANSSGGPRRPGRKGRDLRRGDVKNLKEDEAAPAPVVATATLMEAQEFGEMMEHVDEVNFALDGLRTGQPARIRRASLLSLLSICGTAHQRRLLRAQGMAKKIIDGILGLNFDDSPSTIAAAALFFVLASDVQDDQLLDSPPCIHFLLKLLNPPMTDTVKNKAPTIGSKLLGIRKPQILNDTDKGIDSSSRKIMSKVLEILLSCKEIKSGSGDDEGTERPELSSKWIALLTLEKACLSTVSFEDTSDSVRKVGGNFKERLRELGGLDAVFDVAVSCYSTIERWVKHNSPSVSELKDGVALQNVVLLLKCLKIMENATFLSKDNQDHLLGMRGKLDSEGLAPSFVGIMISSIKLLSGLSLLQSPSKISNGKSTCFSQNVDFHFAHASQAQNQIKQNRSGRMPTGDNGSCCAVGDSHVKITTARHKRQKLPASPSELCISGSEMTVSVGSDDYSMKAKAYSHESDLCSGALSGSKEDSHVNTSRLKMKINANGLKLNINAKGLKVNSGNSGEGSHGWISIRAIGLKTTSSGTSKRPHIAEDVKGDCMKNSYDPFAFDEDELEPSKWEKLAKKKESSQTLQSTVTNRGQTKGYDLPSIAMDLTSSQTSDSNSPQSCENKFPSIVNEESNLLEDCLLISVKVLMNLTNDNPVGCQQIGACGGLDSLASLIVSHFPSFNLYSPKDSQVKDDIPSCSQSVNVGNPNKKYLSDHELEFLVAILGLLVNLVEKDSRNRLRLASARVLVEQPGRSENKEKYKDVIPLLCSIFLANQGSGEAAEEGRLLLSDDEASLMQGEREAEMMIIEAYAALLLAFLSTDSAKVREEIANCLPNQNLQSLVPVLERFVAFHLTLNMISPETHSAVTKVIESCKEP